MLGGDFARPLCSSTSGYGRTATKTYPEKTIKLVVGSTPGGGVDTLARILAAQLPAMLGQSIIVENRPGAGQNIGSAYVAHSAPDGYTLLVTSSSFAVNINLYPDINYDPIKYFAPVALISQSPNLLVVADSLPVKTMADSSHTRKVATLR